jgi:hypothetical protein
MDAALLEPSSMFKEVNESEKGVFESRNLIERFEQAKPNKKILKTNIVQNLSLDNPDQFYDIEQTNDKFLAIKQYECVVESIEGEEIVAKCLDEDGEDQDFISRIDFSEIHKDDHRLVKPGAVFYMTIGRNTNSARTEMNDVDIKFKRIAQATAIEKKHALDVADKIIERLRKLDGFT